MSSGASKAGRRMPVVTVRTRIVAAIALVAALGLLLAGVTAYVVERQRIQDALDPQLEVAVASVRFVVEQEAWASEGDALLATVQRTSPDDNTGTVGVLDGIARWEPGIPLDVSLADYPAFIDRVVDETANGEVMRGTYVEGELVLRYVAVPIQLDQTAGAPRAIYVIGYDVRAELAELDDAAGVYLVTAGIAWLAIVAVGLIIAGRLLRPLRDLRDTAERISAEQRKERIPVTGNDDVSDLTRTVNNMLDRLDVSFESQRQLLDDVGHELKTPVTIVRGHLELMNEDSPADVRASRDIAVAELDRMAALIADISRAAALQNPASFVLRPTDVAELTADTVQRAKGVQDVDVVLGELAHVVVPLDADRITQALLQLVQNAVTHAAGPIEVSSRVAGGSVELAVRDHGQGIPEAQKDALFERFRRAETGRGRDGSGLGLAIVAAIAHGHAGTAHAANAAGGGARFTLRLPLQQPDTEEQ